MSDTSTDISERTFIDMHEFIKGLPIYIQKERLCCFSPRTVLISDLDESKYCVDVDWSYVKFNHQVTKTNVEETFSSTIPTEIYFSEYVNETERDMTYTFSTSCETTNTKTFEMQNGFTLGVDARIDIGEFVTTSGGISAEVNLTDTEKQESTEVKTWNIETPITVQKGHITKASVQVFKKKLKANFKVDTTVSLPHGFLPIAVRKIKGNKVVNEQRITDLRNLFRLSERELPDNLSFIDVFSKASRTREYKIVIQSEGKCQLDIWVNQRINVRSQQLSE